MDTTQTGHVPLKPQRLLPLFTQIISSKKVKPACCAPHDNVWDDRVDKRRTFDSFP